MARTSGDVSKLPTREASGAGDAVEPSASDDRVAAALRGFGPLGLLAATVILLTPWPLLGAAFVLLWAHWSRTPWRDIGYVRPTSWIGSTAVGVALGVALKLVMKAVVMPLLGADPINHAYHYLAGNPAALPGALLAVTIGAGVGEETVYRGWMFERLGTLLGRRAGATVLTVLLTAAWFSAAHYREQGLAGAEQAMMTGLVFGAVFAVSGRLWMVMVAHAAFDVTALAIIYWNLESAVAHLLFR